MANSPAEARQIAYNYYRDEIGIGDFHASLARKNVCYDNSWDTDGYPYGDDGRTIKEIWKNMEA